ncbi:MAG: hypothetical protein U0869_14545 [Chloroflexota bacterium]
MKAQHKAATLLAGVALAVTALPAAAQDSVSFQLWTKEGTGDGSFQFVQKLVDEYTKDHPNVQVALVNKDVEAPPGT